MGGQAWLSHDAEPATIGISKTDILLMEEVLHQLIGSLSHYLQGL